MDRRMTAAGVSRIAVLALAILASGCMGVARTIGTDSARFGGPPPAAAEPVDAILDTAETTPQATGRKPARLPGKRAVTVPAAAAVPAGNGLTVTAPDWQPGDRWRYNDGYGILVEDVSDGLATFRRLDDQNQWITRRGFLREAAQSATTLRQITYRSVPADAGTQLTSTGPLVFTREYTSNGRTLVHVTSWVVEGQEVITVPAGSFQSYIVVMRTRNSATGWTGFERWWYAPEVRNYVRMEYRYGRQPIGSRVLLDFSPGVGKLSKAEPPRPAGIGAPLPGQ